MIGTILCKALGHPALMVTVQALDAIFDVYADDDLHRSTFDGLAMLQTLESMSAGFLGRIKQAAGRGAGAAAAGGAQTML